MMHVLNMMMLTSLYVELSRPFESEQLVACNF